jgi:hypothetical protein
MIEILHKNTPEWDDAVSVVSDTFKKAYGAKLQHFMPHFVRVSTKENKLKAILGYRDAESERLFLEVYLDEPVEVSISRYLGYPVERSSIVEVGNLAESEPGDARMAIIGATAYLHAAGYRWVVFTGITRLRNAFRRLGMEPKELMVADESRLTPEQRVAWGSYYDGNPVVCFGDINEGHDNLQELWASLRDTWARAVEVGERQAEVRKHQK